MTTRIPTPPDARTVIVGVDTHKHVHVAVAIDSGGSVSAITRSLFGYQALITWAETHGRIDAFGIEGTGSYGAGLARAVRRAGHRVVEVNRGDRRTRRAAGKSDGIDAEVAARSVLRVSRRPSPRLRTAPSRCAPAEDHAGYRGEGTHHGDEHAEADRRARPAGTARSPPRPTTACSRAAPDSDRAPSTRSASAKHTLRALARRWMALTEEIAIHDQHLARLTTETSPTLREGFGVGAHTAAELLIVFGDNPDRIRSEPAFAKLCGRDSRPRPG